MQFQIFWTNIIIIPGPRLQKSDLSERAVGWLPSNMESFSWLLRYPSGKEEVLVDKRIPLCHHHKQKQRFWFPNKTFSWRASPNIIYMAETPPWHVYGPIICMDSAAIMISCVRPTVRPPSVRLCAPLHIFQPFLSNILNFDFTQLCSKDLSSIYVNCDG